jgi:hypothetical protein
MLCVGLPGLAIQLISYASLRSRHHSTLRPRHDRFYRHRTIVLFGPSVHEPSLVHPYQDTPCDAPATPGGSPPTPANLSRRSRAMTKSPVRHGTRPQTTKGHGTGRGEYASCCSASDGRNTGPNRDLARAHDMAAPAIGAPERQLQGSETGQRLGRGLDLGGHLTVCGWTTIKEHPTHLQFATGVIAGFDCADSHRCMGIAGTAAFRSAAPPSRLGRRRKTGQPEAIACGLACVVARQARTADVRPQAVDGARRRQSHVAHQGRAPIAVATHSREPGVDQCRRYHVEIGVVLGGEARPIARIGAACAAGLAGRRFAIRRHGDRSNEV